ncbi:hypothetical protein GCM10009717_38600 [Agromyces allii]|uniref:Uncharacterized protein n=1 Tax=Agromyces allii TaxID=393607 RepID=A0ABN2RF14_9MICO
MTKGATSIADRQLHHELGIMLDQAHLAAALRDVETLEELLVDRDELLLVAVELVVVSDGLRRAYRLAGTAIDAEILIDVHHAPALEEAVGRTDLDAAAIFDVHARLGHHKGHFISPSRLRRLSGCRLDSPLGLEYTDDTSKR